MCISTTRFPTLRVAMLATLLGAGAAQGQAVDERVSRCDALASYPADPGRYAAGVTDEQFAPGAAVDACRAAVDADPQLPRSWFQLGRSYWIAQRDEEALAAFVEAAKLGYAPAMKFIGDAYNEGRGLPPGEGAHALKHGRRKPWWCNSGCWTRKPDQVPEDQRLSAVRYTRSGYDTGL